GPVVAQNMPRLLADPSRYALEEATPAPTDVSPLNPGISKERFNTPVRIEANDLLCTLRSDNLAILTDVLGWFSGVSPFGGVGRLPGLCVGEAYVGFRRELLRRRRRTAPRAHDPRPWPVLRGRRALHRARAVHVPLDADAVGRQRRPVHERRRPVIHRECES